MSTPAVNNTAAMASKALFVGLGGIIVTALGLLFTDAQVIAMSWLVGVTFWTAIAIGMLLLVLIHHIFDASWSVVFRRQFEHGLSSFKWLALLAAGLLVWTSRLDLVLDES